MQGQQRKVEEMSAEEKRYFTSCYGFAKEFLRMRIYDEPRPAFVQEVRDGRGNLLYRVNRTDWQRRGLDAVDKHNSRTTIRTCNGAGKTSVIITAAVLWHMTMFPESRVVITSGVQRQVKEQIFPAIRAHEAKFRGWAFHDMRIEAPNGAVCLGFSTDEGGKFEGWHGNKEELFELFQSKGPLLIIVDEAKSVPQEIFDAIERCTYQRLLYASSCGPAEGEFYKSHHDHAASFTTMRVAADECPHADHAKNVQLIDQRGLSDPLVKSKVFSDFMSSAGDTVIDRAAVDAVMAHAPVSRTGGGRKVMCDFAAGGDENVVADRNENKVTIAAAWRERDTMRACSQFIVEFRKLGLTPAEARLIYGDNDGLGKVCIDRLHEMGWPIQRVNNNSAAENTEHYVNRSAEVWWEGGKAIAKGEYILPNDPLLAAQLASRKPHYARGKLAVESKEDMRKRGVSSPDRADAVLECIRPERSLQPVQFMGGDRDFGALDALMAQHGGGGQLAAMSAGNCE